MSAFLRTLLSAGLCPLLWIASASQAAPVRHPAPLAGAAASVGFEEDRGQFDGPAGFVARSPGFTLGLEPGAAVMRLAPGRGDAEWIAVRMALVGGRPEARPVGRDPLPGRSHYLRGSDPSRWVTDVASYATVEYREVYPGIDLLFRGAPSRPEYDFVVAAGADPARIRLAFGGIERARLDRGGDLLLDTGRGVVRQRRPRLYQDVGGERRPVAGAFSLRGPREVGFSVGAYDRERALVIDPVLEYSTYYGGGRGFTGIQDVAVDAEGNAYVAGYYPWDGDRGLPDVFVAKFSPAGVRLFATTIGGTFSDEAKAVAVDALGNVYLTGSTNSTPRCRSFPVTSNAWQPDNGSPGNCTAGFDAFAIKLDPTGRTLLYSSFLGGAGDDWGADVAADARGVIYVAGKTASANFPTTDDAWQGAPGGGTDAFVTAFDPSGDALLYSTYLGGSGDESVARIALTPKREVVVAGTTSSADFPARNRSVQPAFGGGASDAFAAMLTPGGGVRHATFLGGSGREIVHGVATDDAGFVYVTGSTDSEDFPTISPLQSALSVPSQADAFLAKIDARLSGLVYSTYLDVGRDASACGSSPRAAPCGGVAASPAGEAYVTAPGVFALKVDAAGTARQTFHGFGGHGIALGGGPTGIEILVAGRTASPLFPTLHAYDSTLRWYETETGWLTKLTDAPNPTPAFDETDPRIAYTGDWEASASPEDGGAVARSSEAGAKAEITFTGTGIQVIGRRDPSSGFVRVLQRFNFDFPTALLDTYASQTEPRALLLSFGGLPRGTYTLTLEVAGTRNSRSGGTWVAIDGVTVLDDPAP